MYKSARTIMIINNLINKFDQLQHHQILIAHHDMILMLVSSDCKIKNPINTIRRRLSGNSPNWGGNSPTLRPISSPEIIQVRHNKSRPSGSCVLQCTSWWQDMEPKWANNTDYKTRRSSQHDSLCKKRHARKLMGNLFSHYYSTEGALNYSSSFLALLFQNYFWYLLLLGGWYLY